MELEKGKIYHVQESEVSGGILLFKFDGEYTGVINAPNCYYSLNNMNKHWNPGNERFQRPDGTNTYPWMFTTRGGDPITIHNFPKFVSIVGRRVREATNRECEWLNMCHERNITITPEEFRDITIQQILS